MTVLVQSIRSQVAVNGAAFKAFGWRSAALGGLILAVAAVPDGVQLATDAVAEAYLSVTVFVAATMVVLLAAEQLFQGDLGSLLARHQRWQVPAGALLGGLPGCGGAIVAVTQFTRGSLSFGGVVATLTSTMGDAMFLLLAREPSTAGLVFAIGMAAGVVSGYVVDAIHGPRFLQPEEAPTEVSAHSQSGRLSHIDRFWYALLVPGLALGVLSAFQVELDSTWVTLVGTTGGVLVMALWLTRGGESRACQDGVCEAVPQARKVIDDTNFVSAWVVFAFVGYELFVSASGVDLAQAFGVVAAAVPAMGIAVGMIPGCGPQIITTSLYLDGAIPLSAQLGNAISNDGDALFPAIAKAPKAAALATLYTMVPAVVVGYGAYALGW